MKKFIIILLLIFSIIIPLKTDFFVSAAYESGGAVIGSYDIDIWENETAGASTFIKFYNVSPSTDSNLAINIISNKTALVGSKDLYFNFDYGEFYITPFEYYTDYLNSGYQYAPYSIIGIGNMLRFQGSSLQIINKGDLVVSRTLNELYNTFPDFQYLYIIQLVNNVDYFTIFNEGHAAGYNQGYAVGFNEGQSQGFNDGYQDGYNLGSSVGYSRGYTAGLDDGEVIGYNQGYTAGYGDGEVVGYNDGYDYGYNSGYDLGYNDGYQAAVNDGSTDFGIKSLMSGLFVGLGSLLSIELLPNISIGMILAVPVVFGIIAFILGKRGGGD